MNPDIFDLICYDKSLLPSSSSILFQDSQRISKVGHEPVCGCMDFVSDRKAAKANACGGGRFGLGVCCSVANHFSGFAIFLIPKSRLVPSILVAQTEAVQREDKTTLASRLVIKKVQRSRNVPPN